VPAAPPGTLFRRFLLYQRERFPLAVYVPLVAVFTVSAAAYSGALRGADGTPGTGLLLLGTLTALVFFFLLRVLDEHKDAATDRRYRPELPVPRGLISLAELRRLAAAALLLVLVSNALAAPVLLAACLPAALWTALMTREFFVPAWLRGRPALYLVSHMLVLPLIDGYTTGLDWLAEGETPRAGLWLFLLLTLLNGTLLEIGRKLRAPGEEREGVETYTAAWGRRTAPVVWLAVLAAAALVAVAAAAAVPGAAAQVAGRLGPPLLLVPVAALPAVRFLRTGAAAWARRTDAAAALWTLAMYLFLGIGPWLARWS
jgi:4-hydroxybenzoate polyprenyltransferase